MKRLLTIVFIISLLIVDKYSVYAQSSNFIYYPVDASLISGQLKAINNTGDGILWGASDNGVMRFNGESTKYFPTAFPSNYIKSFTKEKNGDILVVHDLGVGKIISTGRDYHFENFIEGAHQFNKNKLFYPKSIFATDNKEYWIGEDSSIVRYKQGEHLRRYHLKLRSQSPHYVRSILFEIDGFKNPWVFSFSGNIFRYNKKKDSFLPIKLPIQINEISWVTKNGFKSFFVGCKQGLFEMEVNRSGQLIKWKKRVNLLDISVGEILSKNKLILGTWSNGAYLVDLHKNQPTYSKINLQGNEDVLSIDYQHGKGIWIGSTESIGLLKELPFNRLDLLNNHVLVESAYITKNGSLIFSEGDSVRQFIKKEGEWKQDYVYSFSDRIRSIGEFEGKLVFGSYVGDIFFTSPNSNKYSKLKEIKFTQSITSFFEDEENNLWIIGEYQPGIYKYSKEHKLSYLSDDNLKDVQVIKGISDGSFYVGTAHKEYLLQRYNYTDQKFENLNLQFPRTVADDIIIRDILIDTETVFLATSDGCFSFDRSTSTTIPLKEIEALGLEKEANLKAIARAGNTLWLASFKGVYRVENGKAQLFDKTNGLPSNAIKIGGLVKGKQKELWIVTEKGLLFHSEDKPLPKATEIQSIKVVYSGNDGVKNLWDMTTDIPYYSNVEVSYTSHSFPLINTKYQYRILSQDTIWSEMENTGKISILNVEGGKYTIEVRSQEKGKLISAVSSITFNVITPWFRQIWFYSVVGVLTIFLFFILIRIYNKNLREKGKRLEYLVEMRAKEIATQRTKIMEQQQELFNKKQKIIENEKSIAEAELKNSQWREEQLQDIIDQKNGRLTAVTLNIVEKNNFLHTLQNQIKKTVEDYPELAVSLNKLNKTIEQSDKTDKDWEEFQLYFDGIHSDFNQKLKEKHPNLTAHDLRHCALIRLNLGLNECANLLGISQDSIKTSRYRLKKKLALENGHNLQDYILSFK
ncbi:ligand-binding sensor domain-containing protein [Flammeovirga kamogawensis]|uniref:HTH luxR-type domain-containing protein n=1 Tax=Flammeovirga kamogawensis TaxID=373891 RepID=A0ABX8GTN6_9BACT|nr:hypothetical protein [Flammeovirga kamogawensis]MBB6459998.1 ligand-binding sensor domain-containing protein/DNA-binding CsgD family transcriptional regulator [Flammeovirga kamogawensis]QWG06954.1 hypothetical protein KM029_16835 [Flammeovirga kamogawensis]TRX68774.1 hypothetical protein EO216_11820 [Flammeovirga kamogawensis]